MKDIVTTHSCWDDNDYIVSIRPKSVEPWKDLPVGPLTIETKAKIVSEWLNVALPELYKILSKIEADPNVK